MLDALMEAQEKLDKIKRKMRPVEKKMAQAMKNGIKMR
jgi:predicted peroxiredoxin